MSSSLFDVTTMLRDGEATEQYMCRILRERQIRIFVPRKSRRVLRNTKIRVESVFLVRNSYFGQITSCDILSFGIDLSCYDSVTTQKTFSQSQFAKIRVAKTQSHYQITD